MKDLRKIFNTLFFIATFFFCGAHSVSAAISGLNVSMRDMVYSYTNYVSFTVDFSGAPNSLPDSFFGDIFTPNYICFMPYLTPDTTGTGVGFIAPWFIDASIGTFTFSNASQQCQPVTASGSGSKFFAFGPLPAGTTGVGIRAYMMNASYPLYSFLYVLYARGSIYSTTATPDPVFPVITTKYVPGTAPLALQDFATVAIPAPLPALVVSVLASPTTVPASPPNDYSVGTNPMGVAFDSATNSVWVVNSFSNNVTKLNATTGALIGTYAVGGAPRNLIFEPFTNSIWVANSFSDNVTKLSANTGAVLGTYPAGDSPQDVVFDSSTNSIWVANYSSNNVTKINASSGVTIGTYAVGTNPMGVIFDSTTNSVWAVNTSSGNVTKLNASSGVTIATYPVGSYPIDGDFDSTTNSIWVANSQSNFVSKLNVNTGSRIDYFVGKDLRAVTFNKITNSVWVANNGYGTASRVNIDTGAKVDYTSGGGSYVAVDNATNSVWVTSYSSNKVRKIGNNASVTSIPLISWSVNDSAATCFASGDWSGWKSAAGGSEYVNTLSTAGSHIYVLSCFNASGGAAGNVTVTAVANTIPTAPVITGPTSLDSGVNGTYTFTATDADGNQIRYGVDWDMDGVADEWIPAGVAYVNSGTTQSTTHNWATTGSKTFQALTQDAPGINSAWTTYNVTVTTPSCVNSAINPPTCSLCAAGYSMYLAVCYANCVNGAINPPLCNACVVGQTYVAGSCVANCSNGATNPPTCNICPVGQTLVSGSCVSSIVCGNGTCEAGENPLGCPQDCKVKYKTF